MIAEENKNQKPEPEKPKEEKPQQKKAKHTEKERPSECVACNKSIKKFWYYRDGNYYCGKRCWKKSKEGK